MKPTPHSITLHNSRKHQTYQNMFKCLFILFGLCVCVSGCSTGRKVKNNMKMIDLMEQPSFDFNVYKINGQVYNSKMDVMMEKIESPSFDFKVRRSLRGIYDDEVDDNEVLERTGLRVRRLMEESSDESSDEQSDDEEIDYGDKPIIVVSIVTFLSVLGIFLYMILCDYCGIEYYSFRRVEDEGVTETDGNIEVV